MLPIHGSQTPPFSFKERIVTALSHTWRIISRESSNFIQKICLFVDKIFKNNVVVKEESYGDDVTLDLPPDMLLNTSNLPPMPDQRIMEIDNTHIEDAKQNDLKALLSELPTLTEGLEKEDCQKRILLLRKEISFLRTIDVPDNGNCLFNAIAVGLRKQYSDNVTIQNKLNWDIPVEELTGNLSHRREMFEQPAALLRAQNAEYIKKSLGQSFIKNSLKEDINMYCEFKEKELLHQKALLPFLESTKDIEDCKKRIVSLDEDIKTLKGDCNFEAYAFMLENDGFYTGSASISALSIIYEVPIRLIYNYGTPGEFIIDPPNRSESGLLPLTIGYVNGNHYVYIKPSQA